MECNQVLSWIFVVVRYIMLAINIICPILLIVSLVKQFIVMMAKPDDKKEFSKIKNSILALIFVFFIPLIINLVISWCDDTYHISQCIENANYEAGNSQYIETNDDGEKKQSVIIDPSQYDSPVVSGRTKLARLAVALAPTAEPEDHLNAPNADPWYKIDDSRLYNFYEVMDLTIKNYGENYAYGSCAQAAGGIIRATIDPDFDVSSSEASLQYLFNHPDKWENVGVIRSGERLDDKLEVGDVLSRDSHLMIYVGNDLARDKFPNTKGNVFQADYSEGNYAKYPSIDYIETDFRDFYIFRPTGTIDSSRPLISIDKYLVY